MHVPIRGGTRGGAAEFRWDAVKTDKDRENYLGHSVNAPAGRWQKNKDIHWYNRENDVGVEALERAAAQRAEEIKRIKQQEEDALAAALGYAPVKREGDADGSGTGANAVAVPKTEKQLELERLEAEEKKARKAAKKERKEIKEMEKEMRREIRRAEKDKQRGGSDRHEHDRRRRHSRSRSPEDRRERRWDDDARPDDQRISEREHARHRDTRSPRREPAGKIPSTREQEPYDPEAERVRDRARWERNHDRERGTGAGWGERHGFAQR